jgi:hypothetical protein
VEAGVSPAVSRDCSRHGCLYSTNSQDHGDTAPWLQRGFFARLFPAIWSTDGITDAGYRGPLLFLGIHSSQKENFIPFGFLLFDLFGAAAAWRAELCDA